MKENIPEIQNISYRKDCNRIKTAHTSEMQFKGKNTRSAIQENRTSAGLQCKKTAIIHRVNESHCLTFITGTWFVGNVGPIPEAVI